MRNTLDLHWLKRFVINLSDRRALAVSFVSGFVIRLIPELLSYPNPIGFDTVMYAAKIHNKVIWSNGALIFSMGLFEWILAIINAIVHIDPFLLLKLAAPFLYALNTAGIYFFSKKTLNWGAKKALIASFFFAFQLASLRMSWDLQKNVLGMAILLFTLSFVKLETKRHFVLFIILSLLLVFTHILVSALLLIVILALISRDMLKGRIVRAVKVSMAIVPVLVVFLVSVYLLPTLDYVPANALSAGDTVHVYPGGLFFLVDYLGVSDPVQSYSTYTELALHVLTLFALLYIVSLPLVLVGFFRNTILDSWVLLGLFGSFNCLITPFFALDLWNRWMFMLVYPFTFYAVNGIAKVSKSQKNPVSSELKYLRSVRVSKRTMVSLVCLTLVLGSVFIAVPAFNGRYGALLIPPANSYFPTTMLYNTVPLWDVKATVDALQWLNSHMNGNSSVLLHRAFLWWGDMFLGKDLTVISYVRSAEKALDVALEHNFSPVYLVWWNENYLTWQNVEIGWYGLIVPKYFIPVFSSDRVTVFKYKAG